MRTQRTGCAFILTVCLLAGSCFAQAEDLRVASVTDRNGAPLYGAGVEDNGAYGGLPAYLLQPLEAMLPALVPTDVRGGLAIALTLDAPLQRTAEEALATLMAQAEGPEAKAAIVVMDVRGCVLAMASADRAGGETTLNHAIATRSAPGEIFLPVPTLAALATDRLSLTATVSDAGDFALYNAESPARCWIPHGDLTRHANLAADTAISTCCYYFAYEMAGRLGVDGSIMHGFARRMGLVGPTGIELAGEAPSIIAGQKALYDPMRDVQDTGIPDDVFLQLTGILSGGVEGFGMPASAEAIALCAREMMTMAYYEDTGYAWENWRNSIARSLVDRLSMSHEQSGDDALVRRIIQQLERVKYKGTDSLQTAIGQSISQVTPLAAARYMAAIANGGYVYPASILEAVETQGGEAILRNVERMPAHDLSGEVQAYLPYIHAGLRGVADRLGPLPDDVYQWPYLREIASIKGYGRNFESGEVDSQWFAGFAPFERPQIVVVVHLRDAGGTPDVFPAAQTILDTHLGRQ